MPEAANVPSVPTAIWASSGTTEHLGGVQATALLLERCQIAPGQTVLDIGCGTGYTAKWIGTRFEARVVALDVLPESLSAARRRLTKTALGSPVALVRADAHHLPFRRASFDAAIAESVLVFGTAAQIAAEVHRALRAPGTFGLNELTFLAPPPQDLADLMVGQLGIRAQQEEGWRSILGGADFGACHAEVRRFSLREQLGSHIQVDGWAGYFRGMAQGLANIQVSRAFLNRRMLRAARRFLPCVGYGLYVARKEGRR